MSDTMRGIVVCKSMTTETAHRLTNYIGKCASIHGHSYKWEVTACLHHRGVQDNGISIDFGDLKAAMREVIYDVFDHALVLDEADVLFGIPALLQDTNGQPQKLVRFPGNPTAENFARYVGTHLEAALEGFGGPPDYRLLRVRVWETANSYGQWTVGRPVG